MDMLLACKENPPVKNFFDRLDHKIQLSDFHDFQPHEFS